MIPPTTSRLWLVRLIEFVFNFKEENLKIVPGNYDVVVSAKLLSRFQNKNLDVTYYIALEPDSSFG